jgi:dienelactone hydrolase
MTHKFSRPTAVALAAIALSMSSAFAAPVQGPADDASFYVQPETMPAGNHGDLIQYRKATVNLGADAPAVNAWNVLYHSQSALGDPIAVSGTVLVPTAAATGTRPVILYAVGTQGLNQRCAPSRQLATGKEYEIENINAALKAGYAVLVSDYEGYVTGLLPTYMVGNSQGKAVLDIFKAATQIPSSGISASAQVGIWGFSQGGQSAAKAGELLTSYAPAIKAVGVAAGGTPADLVAVGPGLDGTQGFAFVGMALQGLSSAYPEDLPTATILTDSGQATLNQLNDECIFESLFKYMNNQASNYTIGAKTVASLMAQPLVNKVVARETLGKVGIPVPLYAYHGRADQFIAFPQHLDLKKAYCAKGTKVTFEMYPGEHIITQFQNGPALAFLADRFAGKAATDTCASTPVPSSTANSNKGDLIVSLTDWKLDAKLRLKTLGQNITLPEGSKLTANANVNTKVLTGNLSIPDFKIKANIIGLKIPVGLTIKPVDGITGSVSLSNEGVLDINGQAKVDIFVTSLVGIPFGACKTTTPVVFPVKFKGPVSALGAGKLRFTGITSFPKITGCQVKGTISAVMSGNGQTFDFTAIPPTPVKN